MEKRNWCGLGGFLLTMGTSHAASATDFFVTDTADTYVQWDGVCSLREAIDTANYNDCWGDCGCGDASNMDTVSLSYGATYTLDDTLYIGDAVVLWGNHAIIRGADATDPHDIHNFFGIRVQTPWYTEFQNVTLENFRHPALLIDAGAAAYMWGLEVRNTTFHVGGGGNASVALQDGAYLYLYGANIHHNVANRGGGIALSTNSWLDLEASLIQYNEAVQYGGGVYNAGHFHCYGGSLIYGNSATRDGGGIYNQAGAVFDGPSNGCHVFGNTSEDGADDIGP